jgi:inner membrane protease ATP23
VRNKAITSVLAVRAVTREEATAAVNKVFSKCYADLEPIGRRIKRNSTDTDKAYAESYMYGYV